MKNLRAFNDDVLISLRDLIGSYNFLNNKSVIQTTLVHDKSKGGLKDLQVIATSPASPKHNIDWFSLNFFRAYSSGIINSVCSSPTNQFILRVKTLELRKALNCVLAE